MLYIYVVCVSLEYSQPDLVVRLFFAYSLAFVCTTLLCWLKQAQ